MSRRSHVWQVESVFKGKSWYFLQKQHTNILLTACSLQMQAGGLDVALLKPPVLILFADWLRLDLYEMRVTQLSSIKGAVARYWSTEGTVEIPGKVLAQ